MKNGNTNSVRHAEALRTTPTRIRYYRLWSVGLALLLSPAANCEANADRDVPPNEAARHSGFVFVVKGQYEIFGFARRGGEKKADASKGTPIVRVSARGVYRVGSDWKHANGAVVTHIEEDRHFVLGKTAAAAGDAARLPPFTFSDPLEEDRRWSHKGRMALKKMHGIDVTLFSPAYPWLRDFEEFMMPSSVTKLRSAGRPHGGGVVPLHVQVSIKPEFHGFWAYNWVMSKNTGTVSGPYLLSDEARRFVFAGHLSRTVEVPSFALVESRWETALRVEPLVLLEEMGSVDDRGARKVHKALGRFEYLVVYGRFILVRASSAKASRITLPDSLKEMLRGRRTREQERE